MVILKEENISKIFESTWLSIIGTASHSLKLTETEKHDVCISPVAKLLAALPYYAGCKNPDQLAVLKICMYLIGCRNTVFFAHRDDQSIRERILPGTYCPSGDPDIVALVTTFLELISINDHLADYDEDMRIGHPNPIGTNILDYIVRKEQLIREIVTYPNQELVQELKTIADPFTVQWW